MVVTLVINGGVYANAFSPFTGTHMVNFAIDSEISNLKPGYLLVSSGSVIKKDIINEKDRTYIAFFSYDSVWAGQVV